MSFVEGNKGDEKHYWLTPPSLMSELDKEFEFDFDPCPFPLPENFDGLTCDWGKSNYVNPPFGSIIQNGKKKGPTAWARKAISEFKKGRKVVLVYPIDKWVLMLLEHASEVRNLKDVKWHSIEDNLPGGGDWPSYSLFYLRPFQGI
jgi:hypothetical protein